MATQTIHAEHLEAAHRVLHEKIAAAQTESHPFQSFGPTLTSIDQDVANDPAMAGHRDMATAIAFAFALDSDLALGGDLGKEVGAAHEAEAAGELVFDGGLADRLAHDVATDLAALNPEALPFERVLPSLRLLLVAEAIQFAR